MLKFVLLPLLFFVLTETIITTTTVGDIYLVLVIDVLKGDSLGPACLISRGSLL